MVVASPSSTCATISLINHVDAPLNMSEQATIILSRIRGLLYNRMQQHMLIHLGLNLPQLRIQSSRTAVKQQTPRPSAPEALF